MADNPDAGENRKVCPRCGTPAGDSVWCAGCGLNLSQQGELPTADAYAAKIREQHWLAGEEARHREEQEHRMAEQQRQREDDERRQAATSEPKAAEPRQPEPEAAAPPAGGEPPPTAARRSRRSLLAAGALLILVLAGVGVALALGNSGRSPSTDANTTPTRPSPNSPTTTAPAPSPSAPVLGVASAWRSGEGFGSARPSRVFFGGDPTGLFTDLRWSGWGQQTATASGIGHAPPPGRPVSDSVRVPVELKAFSLGTCDGRQAYQKLTITFRSPQQPEEESTVDACRGLNPSTGQTGTSTCSPGVTVFGEVSCELASNVFYKLYRALREQPNTQEPPPLLSVWSPVSRRYYTADCRVQDSGDWVCIISGTGTSGGNVEITPAALDDYTPQHADDYARTHDLGPNG